MIKQKSFTAPTCEVSHDFRTGADGVGVLIAKFRRINEALVRGRICEVSHIYPDGLHVRPVCEVSQNKYHANVHHIYPYKGGSYVSGND